MSKMVGLSRQRFGQLVKEGVFPPPDHDAATGRPFFNAEKQQQCLLVRQTNTGINGRPILFYSKRCDAGIKRGKSQATTPKVDAAIVQQLRQLGIALTVRDIEGAMAAVFPDGIKEVAHESVVKSLFLHFRRKNRTDMAG
jgi:hypothetical protein